jgi:hypothetical protein
MGILWCLSLLACLFVAKIVYGNYRMRYVRRHFDSVQIGDTKEVVIAKLGKPNYHSGAWLKDLSNCPGCVEELVYSDPLLPEYYVVDLSSKGRVIRAEHLISP